MEGCTDSGLRGPTISRLEGDGMIKHQTQTQAEMASDSRTSAITLCCAMLPTCVLPYCSEHITQSVIEDLSVIWTRLAAAVGLVSRICTLQMPPQFYLDGVGAPATLDLPCMFRDIHAFRSYDERQHNVATNNKCSRTRRLTPQPLWRPLICLYSRTTRFVPLISDLSSRQIPLIPVLGSQRLSCLSLTAWLAVLRYKQSNMALSDVWDIALLAGKHHSDRIAYVDQADQKVYSYGDLLRVSTQLAEWLYAQGVRKGTRVAVMLHNSFEVLLLHFAAAALHAVIVNINTHWVAREVSLVIQDSSPLLAFIDLQGLSALTGAIDAVTQEAVLADSVNTCSIQQVIVTQPMPVPDTATMAPESCIDFSTIFTHKCPAWKEDSSYSNADGYQMYYTSGTTGRPKGVVLSHHIVLTHALGTIQGTRSTAYGMRTNIPQPLSPPICQVSMCVSDREVASDSNTMHFAMYFATSVLRNYDTRTFIFNMCKYECSWL